MDLASLLALFGHGGGGGGGHGQAPPAPDQSQAQPAQMPVNALNASPQVLAAAAPGANPQNDGSFLSFLKQMHGQQQQNQQPAANPQAGQPGAVFGLLQRLGIGGN